MAIIDKPTDYFDTKLYTGNGGTQSITGLDFQPDWVWIKDRDGTYKHLLVDSVRGATKHLSSSSAAVEVTNTANVTSFTSDGFALSSDGNVNANADKYVSWNWKANGSGSSNTAGSINSTVSANTTSGFSIVKYTGTGANATVGHGLGSVPKMIIVKDLDDAENWEIYNASVGATKSFYLNTTNAPFTSSERWNDTSPTNSVFSVGTAKTNNANNNIIAYCFADVQSFSKFGSYLGNSANNGTFVYTGFTPALIIVKRTNSTGNWVMHDNRRSLSNGFNVNQYILYSNTNTDEITDESKVDLLSNGFKFRNALTDQNANGSTYIYLAFAENPFVTSTDNNSIPTTAR